MVESFRISDSTIRRLTLNFFFHNLHRATQTFLRASGQKQRANRVDRHALPSDDFANIRRIQPQFINRHARALHRRDLTAPGFCTSPLTTYSRNSCMRENQIKPPPELLPPCPAFLMKLATVSLGCAPLLIQYCARSSLSVKLSPCLSGLISADLLDELAIAGTAAIGHDNAECRRVFRADPFHANFY